MEKIEAVPVEAITPILGWVLNQMCTHTGTATSRPHLDPVLVAAYDVAAAAAGWPSSTTLMASKLEEIRKMVTFSAP